MTSRFRRAGVAMGVAAAAFLAGCAATTHLEGTKPGTTLALHGVSQMDLPQDRDLASKATGQYEFMATAPSGQTMYGILPLHVSGSKMAGSILLFAPALFIGGFRDVLPFYQFDPDANELRYKSKAQDEWRVYKPLQVEAMRAKNFFDTVGPCGGAKDTAGAACTVPVSRPAVAPAEAAPAPATAASATPVASN